MGPLLVLAALSACVDCIPFDAGAGIYACDEVEICTQGDDGWFRADDGEVYVCDSPFANECFEMLCDQCNLDAETRAFVCAGA